MRVAVDHDVCEANAVCMAILPEVFQVGEDDVLSIVQERPPAEWREKVEEAVRRCPKGALSLEED